MSKRAAEAAGMALPPMTAEQIEAARSGRLARALEWANRNAECLVLAAMLALPASLVCGALASSMGPGAGRCVLAWGERLAGLLALLGMGGLWVDPLAPADKTQREAILAILPALPNGESFRASVEAQGREFTEREWRQAIKAKEKMRLQAERESKRLRRGQRPTENG